MTAERSPELTGATAPSRREARHRAPHPGEWRSRIVLAVAALGLSAVSAGPTAFAQPTGSDGYYLVGSDGGVFAFGAAQFDGSLATHHLAAPIIGLTSDLHGDGYWLVGRDGGVFAFGNAPFLGSAVGLLAGPIVATSTIVAGGYEGGYLVCAADGSTAAFLPGAGPALSPPIRGLDGPVVACGEAGGSAGGYYEVTTRGQVLPAGPTESNRGDASGVPLVGPVVGIAVGGANANGYQLAASDGGVFDYGTTFSGSTGDVHLAAAIVGTALVTDGSYYLAAADGGVFSFGGAAFDGSAAGTPLASPIVGMSLAVG